MRWVLGYTAALCVLVLIISQSVVIPSFFMPFFRWHNDRVNENGQTIACTLGMTQEDLMRVTVELLDYMRGSTDDMTGITANAHGFREYGEPFFTETEIEHMVDVRRLYELLFIARNVAFFLLIALVLGMFLLKDNPLFLISRCAREVLASFFAIMIITAGIIALDFDRAWTVFHYIFFWQDAARNWLLMPYTDLMINMYPLEFFMHIAIFFAGLVTIFSAIVIVLATVYLRYVMRLPRFAK